MHVQSTDCKLFIGAPSVKRFVSLSTFSVQVFADDFVFYEFAHETTSPFENLDTGAERILAANAAGKSIERYFLPFEKRLNAG